MENTNIKVDIQEEFKLIRRVLGLTQVQFAKLIQVKAEAISKIENGKAEASKDVCIKAYTEMLGISRLAKSLGLNKVEVFAVEEFSEFLKSYIYSLQEKDNNKRKEIFENRKWLYALT